MNALQMYQKLKKQESSSYWEKRILSEIGFLFKVSEVQNHSLDGQLSSALEELIACKNEHGAITNDCAKNVEQQLSVLSKYAKKYSIICAAHAHIDMNWMWGFQETVSLTIDTFRTMLQLLKEYPAFVFSQSQASTYQIIEKYYPEMLPEIKKYIKEGRWEVTASTWTECDKNMPNAESLSRQMLYTRKYLSSLLEITPGQMEVDFEPDTFGHSANLPEILKNGGVKYLYHCRGFEGPNMYQWESLSGERILVYSEPSWYNADIDFDMFLPVPEFCRKHNINFMLKLYGVGDHGGGPTRRDIEMILDMSSWPLMPSVTFGTYHEFFRKLEEYKDFLPVVKGELNYVFTGCYTAQPRIKLANRVGENRLFDSEMLCAFSSQQGDNADYLPRFENAWRKQLFNQFHDIIPGSGVRETREYAMGAFQDILAYADSNANQALHYLANAIDTSDILTAPDALNVSEGAGVGFNISDAQPGMIGKSSFQFPQTERGRGLTRIYHAFNTTQYDRSEVVEFTLWDWAGNLELLTLCDKTGKEVPVQILEKEVNYRAHTYTKFLAFISVPAFGYNTYIVKEKSPDHLTVFKNPEPRLDKIFDDHIILENRFIRAEFEQSTMELLSLTDKSTGSEMIDVQKHACYFQYALETTNEGYLAWRIGRFKYTENLNRTCPVNITDVCLDHLRQSVHYDLTFHDSALSVTISLGAESKSLEIATSIDWLETGNKDKGMPNLIFMIPLSYTANHFKYDIPAAFLERNALCHDVPANTYICAPNTDVPGSSLMLFSDSKYGFRGCSNTISVTLLHSSYDPDKYPEFGINNAVLGIGIVDASSPASIKRESIRINHPVYVVSNTSHPGSLPGSAQLLSIQGNILVSSVKQAESGSGEFVCRLYNPNSIPEKYTISSETSEITACTYTDIHETPLYAASLPENNISAELQPYQLVTLRIRTENAK